MNLSRIEKRKSPWSFFLWHFTGVVHICRYGLEDCPLWVTGGSRKPIGFVLFDMFGPLIQGSKGVRVFSFCPDRLLEIILEAFLASGMTMWRKRQEKVDSDRDRCLD